MFYYSFFFLYRWYLLIWIWRRIIQWFYMNFLFESFLQKLFFVIVFIADLVLLFIRFISFIFLRKKCIPTINHNLNIKSRSKIHSHNHYFHNMSNFKLTFKTLDKIQFQNLKMSALISFLSKFHFIYIDLKLKFDLFLILLVFFFNKSERGKVLSFFDQIIKYQCPVKSSKHGTND
jgi:hypothetical protein